MVVVLVGEVELVDVDAERVEPGGDAGGGVDEEVAFSRLAEVGVGLGHTAGEWGYFHAGD